MGSKRALDGIRRLLRVPLALGEQVDRAPARGPRPRTARAAAGGLIRLGLRIPPDDALFRP